MVNQKADEEHCSRITRVQALDYRCLRYVDQHLGPFHVLVGANASGKTTFLDVVAFLGRLVSDGLDAAISERTQNFEDLVWKREGNKVELAIELDIPEALQIQISKDRRFRKVRYEVAIGVTEERETGILAENALFKPSRNLTPRQPSLFPEPLEPPGTVIEPRSRRDTRTIIRKVPGGNDNFYSEVYGSKGKGWAPAFKLGSQKSALGNLPEDESKFPVSTWLKNLLSTGVQSIILNSQVMRLASPPGRTRHFKTDGSNLPWVIEDLKVRDPGRFDDWLAHLQTALPDLETIETVERPDDKHRYLVLRYRGGLRVPSWTASDGTLRLLGLTIPAYLPAFEGIYLIEEPENGIHPRAVETLFRSLSNVYGAQILLATHSPVILSVVEPEQLLCFAKNEEGATDIVRGTEHPALAHWQYEQDLSTLFAAGVFG